MVELIWDGKYRDGKRVAPVRLALPFQTVETVNESAQDRKRTLDLFATGKTTDWRNRLIWGDKKYVLPSLLAELAGKVRLIYIDPPFDTGADFSFTTEIPGCDEKLDKQPSIIEQKAYRDTWGRGLDSYLHWFYEGVVLLRELLADDGSLYVHLDSHVGHYAKAVLDEVFGSENFFSQIVWKRYGAHGDSKKYGAVHDLIFFYGKTAEACFNKQFVPYEKEYAESRFRLVDKKSGRRYQEQNLSSPSPRPNLRYPYKASNGVTYQPHPNGWKCEPERMKQLDKEGRLHYPEDPKGRLRLKMFLDESEGVPVQDVWTDMVLASSSDQRVGYPTQKPEALLERIIKTSSNEGDLVLDCFGGSGTTAAVAERLGRRWITCDLGRFAIHTTRKRLLSMRGLKPFVVQNLGKYERQAWMASEFERPEDRAATEAAYRKFVLELYHASPIGGHTWIHGVKGSRMIHVGAVDAPVTLSDVKSLVKEVWRANNSSANASADILGWEFAFELNETAKQVAAENRVELKFRRIPREVLEKKAIDQGDIQPKDFFELRALSTKLSQKKRIVTLELTDFILPSEDLPEDVARAVKHWSQWIDYWAIDWNCRNDTFHNEWQSYRTREEPDLELRAQHEYREPGRYEVVTKVIDILGNDTTKSLSIEVK